MRICSNHWFKLQGLPAFRWLFHCSWNRCVSERAVKMTGSKQPIIIAATLLPQLFSRLSLADFGEVKDDCALKVCSWLLSGCGPHRALRGSEGLAHINHPLRSLLGWDQGSTGSWWKEAAPLRTDTKKINTDRVSKENNTVQIIRLNVTELTYFPQSLAFEVS